METPDSSECYRLFIAIPPSDEVQARIHRVQTDLRRALPHAQVRWSPASQFHLTLRFLGPVESRQVDSLTHTLQELCRHSQPLTLQAGRIGFFPSARSPRVIWIGISDQHGRLPALHQALAQALPAAQPDSDTPKPREQAAPAEFVGHITLGRVKTLSRAEIEQLNRLAAGYSAEALGSWTAPSVELIRSQLSPQGAAYTLLAKAPLEG